jgi:iron complex outermembrane recepter protein
LPSGATRCGRAAAPANGSSAPHGYLHEPGCCRLDDAFDLRKPYFNLDARNVFTELGSLRTRGVEISLAGRPAEGLNLVAGVALMDPKVMGEAVELGRVGERPVAQTQKLRRANADYRLPFWRGASVDAGLVYTGPVAASVRVDPSTGRQLHVPARAVIDLGGRYRFDLVRTPAVVRVQLQNATDAGGWRPTQAGGFQTHDPRRISVSLAIDL